MNLIKLQYLGMLKAIQPIKNILKGYLTTQENMI